MNGKFNLNNYDCRSNDISGCIECSQTFSCVEELTTEIARLRKALEEIKNTMIGIVRTHEIQTIREIARQALEEK